MRKTVRFLILGIFAILLWMGFNQNPQPSTAKIQTDRIAEMHQNDRPIATDAIAPSPRQEVSAKSVTYAEIDGTPITGYLARPETATEPLPGLIAIHEWWGLNENIEAMTRRLAGEGYVVLAVDLYGDRVAETPEVARSLVESTLENSTERQKNLIAAYEYLTSEANAPKVASIGWCFGGSRSLETALLLPEKLDAAVIYYGGEITGDRDRLQPLEMPILGHFGELDSRPSPETARAFESALKSLGKTAEIYIYPDADHAFANPSGTRYNPEAAELAWQRTIEFLQQYL